MKILHIINDLRSGGAEKLIEISLPLYNDEIDISVELLILSDKRKEYYQNLINNNIKIHISPINSMRNPLNVIYINKVIEKGGFDVVHAHLFPSFYWVSIATILKHHSKIKFVMTEHSTNNKRRENKYLRVLEKFIYGRYDIIHSISEDTQINLIEWLKPQTRVLDRFKIIENGIEVNKFKNANPLDRRLIHSGLKFDEKEKIICMTGSFTKQKDQMTIIKAMLQLPRYYHLLLIGEGPLKAEYIIAVKALNLDNRVHFLGFRNDVQNILKSIDLFILSSYWEGFGLAAVEGMASGKPVLASNVSGLKNVINDQELLFEPGNVDELVGKIMNLLNDAQLYDEKARQCELNAEKYDINEMVNQYIESYRL